MACQRLNSWAVAPPGATACDVTGLPRDVPLRLRAFTGVDGGAASGTNGALPSGGAPGLPTSQPSGAVDALLLLQARLNAYEALDARDNWSFHGFLDASVRFQHLSFNQYTGADLATWVGSSEQNIVPVNLLEPLVQYTLTRTFSPRYATGADFSFAPDSNTAGHGDKLMPPGYAPDLAEKYQLSQELKLADFWDLADAVFLPTVATVPSNHAVHDHVTLVPPITEPDPRAYGADHAHLLSKVFYGFQVNKDPNGHLGFDEVFLPKGGGPPVHHVQTWDTNGAVASPNGRPYTLDPLLLNAKALGSYRVLAVELRATDHRDDPGVPGGLVPSVKTDGTGGKHFVVPRQAGGTVSVRAVVSGELEPGVKFDDLYEFAPLGSDAVIAGDVCQVKTDRADRYAVQLRTKDAAHTVLASMNVWVVWCDPIQTQVEQTQISAGQGPDGDFTFLQGGRTFTAAIQPASIVGPGDVPKLDDAPVSDTPETGKIHLNDGQPLHRPLHKWDISRQYRCKIVTANFDKQWALSIATAPLVNGGGIYAGIQGSSATSLIVDYPPDDPQQGIIEGNDDSEVEVTQPKQYGENSNPYEELPPGVAKGVLYDADGPSHPVALNAQPPNGASIEVKLQFREFCRLEIAGQWYRISDPLLWRSHGKLTKNPHDRNGDGKIGPTEVYDRALLFDTTNADW